MYILLYDQKEFKSFVLKNPRTLISQNSGICTGWWARIGWAEMVVCTKWWAGMVG